MNSPVFRLRDPIQNDYTMVKKINKNKKTIKGEGAYSMASLSREVQRAAEQAVPNPKRKGTWQNAAARTAGGWLGSTFGPVGAALGNSAGGALSRFLGYGTYSVKRNTLLTSTASPGMHSNNVSVLIRHREYISDVITSATAGNFSVNSFNLNPGLATTFPWLGPLAQNYQEYRIKGMVIEYKPKSGNAVGSNNTALGTVIIATQYNPKAAAFTSKFAMDNEAFVTDCLPYECMYHPIECDPKQNPFNVQLVRGGALASTDDIKEYDWGIVSVATQGSQGTSVNFGELYIIYEIELLKPALLGSLGSYYPVAHYISTTYTNALPFKAATAKLDTIGLTVTGTVITLPANALPGSYLVNLIWYGSAVTNVNPALTPTNGLAAYQMYLNDTSTAPISTPSVSGTNIVMLNQTFQYIPLPNVVGTLTIGATGTLPSSGISCDIFVYYVNSSLTL